MAKKYQLKKKKRETRKCFKCDEKEHIAKNCKRKQLMKNHKVQEESDNEDDNRKNSDKKQGFGEDLKQA